MVEIWVEGWAETSVWGLRVGGVRFSLRAPELGNPDLGGLRFKALGFSVGGC